MHVFWTFLPVVRTFRRQSLLVVTLVLVLCLGGVSLPLTAARAHVAGTGDLMSGVPKVDEHDRTSSDPGITNNACGLAAATMLLDYYFLPSRPAQAAPSIDAVAPYVPVVSKSGTSPEQMREGIQKASIGLNIGVTLTPDAWNTTDSDRWFSLLQAELDQHRPVVLLLDDGGALGWAWHYPHFIVVSGYSSDNAIIYHDPWDGVAHTLPNATFARAWGATWHGYSAWWYLRVLPPGAVAPTGSPTALPRQAGAVTEFSLPTANSQPNAIVTGPDGNLWFTQSGGGNVDANPSGGCSCVGSIGRITPGGSVKVFYDANLHNTGDGSLQPEGITVGPNGNLWFVMADQFGIGYVGQITPGGSFTESAVYSADGGIALNTMTSIAVGPDGNVWFTAQGGLGRVSSSGEMQEFPLSDSSIILGGIAVGSDGDLWFSESTGIGRITPSGTITEFAIDPSVAAPAGITRGPDGSMWFAEQNAIGRITTSGSISQFPLSQPNSHPSSITAGPDGNLWFTESSGIGRITTGGEVTVFPVSAQFTGTGSDQGSGGSFQGITSGPNGNLWFIDPASNKIGEITP